MAPRDPNVVTDKWAANLSGSVPHITAGVQAVTTAPGQQAAAAKDLWASQVLAAKDKWAARVGAVTLDQWKTATLTKGVNRIAGGAEAAKPKMAAFLADFLPFQERIAQTVRAMPKGNLEAGIARSAAMIRQTAAYKRK